MDDVKIHDKSDIGQTPTSLSEVPLARLDAETASHKLDTPDTTGVSNRELQEHPSDTRYIDNTLRSVEQGWQTALDEIASGARMKDAPDIPPPRKPFEDPLPDETPTKPNNPIVPPPREPDDSV